MPDSRNDQMSSPNADERVITVRMLVMGVLMWRKASAATNPQGTPSVAFMTVGTCEVAKRPEPATDAAGNQGCVCVL